MSAGDSGNAFALLQAALDSDVDYTQAYHNLAVMVCGAGRYDAAIALSRRALASEPDNGHVWDNLGNTLWRAQRFAEAEAALTRARDLLPDHYGPHHNLGLLYYATGRSSHAIASFRRALAIKPDAVNCLSDLAHAVLKSGDLALGLDLLEVRWAGMLIKNPIWDCGLPKWNGEEFGGKTLLLHHEQGFGDTLQFVRFIPEIIRRFAGEQATGPARIVLAAPKALHRLLRGHCKIDLIIDIDSPGDIVCAARDAHFHCPLISAVALCKPSYETIPSAPYLTAQVHCDRSFRDGGAKLAVGLVWAASPGHERSRQRSVPVGDLLDLGTIPGVRLWSLQIGPYAQERIDSGAEYLVGDATAGISDFADTAAVVQKLDLVVAVDTAAVHVAGALGKPCFMLNPINPCWRWCKGAAPWYPSVELFDQVAPENWRAPLAAIKQRIAAMADSAVVIRG